MNIIVYAISNISGGALSVLNDYYNEIVEKRALYPEVKWIFVLSTQNLQNTENCIILNYPKSTSSWIYRVWFEKCFMRKIEKKYDAEAIVSLQNKGVTGSKLPLFISLHNILPAYRCGFDVFDTMKEVLKQVVLNRAILSDMKKAKRVFVPSEWVKERFCQKFGIASNTLEVIKCRVPNIEEYEETTEQNPEMITFFYPATAYPYKNIQVILDACKKLQKKGITQYRVLLTFSEQDSKTAIKTKYEIEQEQLNVQLVGKLPRQEVLRLYQTAVLLFVSHIEMDAMPLVECAQLGGYTIAADLPYAHEALSDYEGVQYYAVDDAKELAAAMEKLIAEGKPQTKFVLKNAAEEGTPTRVDKIVEIVRNL